MKVSFRLFVLAVFAICLSMVACSRERAAAQEPPAPAVVPGAPAAAPSAVGPAPAEPVTKGKIVISEAELSIRSNEPERAAEEVSRAVAARGGFVVTKEAARSDDAIYRVELVLRVPSADFELALAEVRRRGTVLKESASGRDVTEEYTDTEAQTRAKRRLEERLLAIVAASRSVKEMLEVETELGRVRGDIERLEGHSRYLANRASFSTIHASFVSPSQPLEVAEESVSSRLRNAMREARTVFVSVTAGLIVAMGAILPALVPVLLVMGVRRRRRRLAVESAVG